MTFDYEEYIKKYFRYNKETGELERLDRKNANGSLDKDGYLIFKIKGKQFKSHRVVWLLCNGSFPKGEIDHIDRNRTNNKIENLRVVNRGENIQNIAPIINKDTGQQHIYLDKTTKGLKARYTVRKGKLCFRFRTLEEAKKKRDELWNNK